MPALLSVRLGVVCRTTSPSHQAADRRIRGCGYRGGAAARLGRPAAHVAVVVAESALRRAQAQRAEEESHCYSLHSNGTLVLQSQSRTTVPRSARWGSGDLGDPDPEPLGRYRRESEVTP